MGERETFLLEEFKALKTEIAALVATTTSNLQWAAVGSGGIFAWLFSSLTTEHKDGLVPAPVAELALVGYAPLALSAVLAAQSLAAYLHIWRKGKYLAKVEKDFFDQPITPGRVLPEAPPSQGGPSAGGAKAAPAVPPEPPKGSEAAQGSRFGGSFWAHLVAWLALMAADLVFGGVAHGTIAKVPGPPRATATWTAPAQPLPSLSSSFSISPTVA